MNLSAIAHRPVQEYIYPLARSRLYVQLLAARENLESVTLLWWERTSTDLSARHEIEMEPALRDAHRCWYRTELATPGPATYLRYCFVLKKEKETVWYGAKGFSFRDPALNRNFFEFLWPNRADGFAAPEWSREQIYYQIFPERFCRGRGAPPPEGVSPWGSTPTRENFMGGNLAGICENLDYIRSLGVTCLYLTPIFKAPSNHKYDTVDYYAVDPRFGSAADLHALVDAVHRKGMRILLDGVFNHCGYYYPPFQDVLEKGEASAYRSWFFVEQWPVCTDPPNYDCVGNYKWMPKLNLDDPAARRCFIDVGRYWIREFGIDGWRLDVADEISTGFWEEFVREIRQEFPEALFLGESWQDAGRLIFGNRLDSAMNYVFRDAVVDWIAREEIDATGFDSRINAMAGLYPPEVLLRLYNPLDSHDTARFLYEAGDDVVKLKLAAALQMTLPGCPAIFYGDEVGLSGANDPDCRQAMEWEAVCQNRDLQDWYRQLAHLRNASSSLRHGTFRTCLCSARDNVYGFLREDEAEYTAVLVNAARRSAKLVLAFPQDGQWLDRTPGAEKEGFCSAAAGGVTVTLPGRTVKIYQKRKEENKKTASRVNLDSLHGMLSKSTL